MGISGLLPMLKSIQRPCNLKKFSGLTLGVDAYVWLHRGAHGCAMDIALGKHTTKYLDFAMHRVRMLLHHGITPYVVFDGDHLPSKAKTESERREKRRKSRNAALALHHKGDIAQAQVEFQKAVDITPEMAGQFIQELQKANIAYIVAPYEADAQLAYLERKGLIQGVVSEDSDLLVFGCRRLLTKLDQYGDCIEVNRDDFAACKDTSFVGWTDADFRRMAILSGCDYLDNIRGLGLKGAYRLIRKFKTTERVIQRLNFDTKFQVPATYLEDFHRAERTFLYQWVFCPTERRLVRCTELDAMDPSLLDFLGPQTEPSIALGLADGSLHPNTKQPLVIAPIMKPSRPQPWAMKRPSTPATPLDRKIGKPIETFFRSGRVPLAELDPNLFTPSPSQQQLQAGNRSWLSSPAVALPQLSTPSIALPATADASLVRVHTPSTPIQREPREASGRNSSSRRPMVLAPLSSHEATTPVRVESRATGLDSRTTRAARVPKRQRLCEDESIEDSGYHLTEPIRSKFFQGTANTRVVGTEKEHGRKGKRSTINIWSDDSVEGIMAEMLEVSEPKKQKMKIFTETKTCDMHNCVKSIPSESSNLTESSGSSISTAHTSESFLEHGEATSKYIPILEEAKEESPSSSTKHATTPLQQSNAAAARRSMSTEAPRLSLLDNLKGDGLLNESEEGDSRKGFVPRSPVSKTGNEVSTTKAASNRFFDASHHVSETAGLGMGSEDLLVPQSEDEDVTDDAEALPAPRIDLSRFRFRA